MFGLFRKKKSLTEAVAHHVERERLRARVRVLEVENAALRRKLGLGPAPFPRPKEVELPVDPGPMRIDRRSLAEVTAERRVPRRCDDPGCECRQMAVG